MEFFDATNVRNTLVQTTPVLGYRRPVPLRGNLLFAEDLTDGAGFFSSKKLLRRGRR